MNMNDIIIEQFVEGVPQTDTRKVSTRFHMTLLQLEKFIVDGHFNHDHYADC